VHPKFKTPWAAILLATGLGIAYVSFRTFEQLADAFILGIWPFYALSVGAVYLLRRRRPDLPRPYRGPGNLQIGSYDAPLLALVGGGFTAIAFVVIVVLNPGVAAIGTGWLIVGIVVYAAFRRRQGLDLASTHKVAIAQPVVDHEAEYNSVLVHVGEEGYDPQLIATAAKLAARRRRGIHVLVTIPVPNALPIDADMADAEAAAESTIEQAKLQGGRRVSGHWEKVRAGQAGRRIIEEAQDMRAAAVVMTLPRRVAGTSVFGKTIETVLAERPCRVIIESQPGSRVTGARPVERPKVTA
jgi:APA family basic amino acid/polyamine antiporter